MRKINILGATGSVGSQAAELIRENPGLYRVGVLAADKNAAQLARLAVQLGADHAAVADVGAYDELKRLLANTGIGCSNQPQLAATTPADVVLVASGGISGFEPLLQALASQEGIVAVANKEAFLLGGRLVMERAARSEARLIPVDSEHSAVYRLSQGGSSLKRIILTASGGPFYGRSRRQLTKVTPKQALAHPNWQMGDKITIDSATLMNKGIEVIEASHLFALAPENIEVVVQRDSLVHAVVEFADGSCAAGLGEATMKTPLAAAFMFPHCPESNSKSLDFTRIELKFSPPDEETFPCLRLAKQAFAQGETATVVLCAANQVAVAAFLADRLAFLDISELIASTLAKFPDCKKPITTPSQALEAYAEAVAVAEQLLERRLLKGQASGRIAVGGAK